MHAFPDRLHNVPHRMRPERNAAAPDLQPVAGLAREQDRERTPHAVEPQAPLTPGLQKGLQLVEQQRHRQQNHHGLIRHLRRRRRRARIGAHGHVAQTASIDAVDLTLCDVDLQCVHSPPRRAGNIVTRDHNF